MAAGIYFSLDEVTLLQMRADTLLALKAARTGQRFETLSAGGKSFSKAHLSLGELQTELAEITAALKHVNPCEYGGKSVSRLTVAFS